jgi:hypothetical protein
MNPPHKNFTLRQFDALAPRRNVFSILDFHTPRNKKDAIQGWFYHNRVDSLLSNIHAPSAQWKRVVVRNTPNVVLLGMLWKSATEPDTFYVTNAIDCRDHRDQYTASTLGAFVHEIQSVPLTDTRVGIADEATTYVVKRVRIGKPTPNTHTSMDLWNYFIYLDKFLTVATFNQQQHRLNWKCPVCRSDTSLSIEDMGNLSERRTGTSLATDRLVPLITTEILCQRKTKRSCVPGCVRVACQGMIPFLSDDEMLAVAKGDNNYLLSGI